MMGTARNCGRQGVCAMSLDQLTVGRGGGDDLKGAMSSGGQFGLWVCGVDVGSF